MVLGVFASLIRDGRFAGVAPAPATPALTHHDAALPLTVCGGHESESVSAIALCNHPPGTPVRSLQIV